MFEFLLFNHLNKLIIHLYMEYILYKFHTSESEIYFHVWNVSIYVKNA